MIVIDCSILVADTLADENNSEADHVLQLLANNKATAIVPGHFYLECANVLLMAYKKQRINKTSWQNYLDTLAILPLEIDGFVNSPTNLSTLSTMAENHGLSVYDAAYLELANRLNIPLATLDRELNHAAVKIGLPQLSNK